jgi:CMP-N-acetylneuraminic acid synthetase
VLILKVNAIVPLKGNSERVKDKNIRAFAGEPLFFHIIKTLKQCNAISKIFIDTDSDVIADLAVTNFNNINIIKRPNSIRGDKVSMNEIIKYDLSIIEGGNHFIQTHATNPLLEKRTIEDAIKLYFAKLNMIDSVFSVTKLHTRLYDHEYKPMNHNPLELIPTQELSPIYEENSNFYIFSKESFKLSNNRIGNRPYLFEMNRLEAVDIDIEEEFTLAELLYKTKKV